MSEEIIRLGKLEVNLDELTVFLVEAKINCYASEGEEAKLSDSGRRLVFQQDNFHYTDEYAGYFQAPGSEIVRWKRANGQRIWTMSYSGGMLPKFQRDLEKAKKVYKLLKSALGLVNPVAPFRGPEGKKWVKGEIGESMFIYKAKTEGDIKRFRGREIISEQKQDEDLVVVYSQEYIGGLVIPK